MAAVDAAAFNLQRKALRSLEPLRCANPYLSTWPGGIRSIDVRLEPDHAGWRLDRALAAAVPTLSRERLKALIRSGALTPASVRDPAIKVHGDEAFQLAVPEPEPAHNEAQDIPLTSRLRGRASAGHRQAGRAGRPSGGRQPRPDVGQRLAPPLRRQPVGHRRGRPARDRPPHRQGHVGPAGGRQDRRRARGAGEAVRRAQHRPALSGDRHRACRRAQAGRSTRRSPARRPTARRSRSSKDGRGKRAVTHWKRLEPLRDAALVECRLETGRTHQVRVHMASIGHPLLGDPVYGGSGKTHRKLLNELGLSSAGAARGGAWVHPSGDEAPAVVRERHAVRHAGTVHCAWCIGIDALGRFSGARPKGERRRQWHSKRASSRSPRPDTLRGVPPRWPPALGVSSCIIAPQSAGRLILFPAIHVCDNSQLCEAHKCMIFNASRKNFVFLVDLACDLVYPAAI